MSYSKRNRKATRAKLAKKLQVALPGQRGERLIEVSDADCRFVRCGTQIRFWDKYSHMNDVWRTSSVFSIVHRPDGSIFLHTEEVPDGVLV